MQPFTYERAADVSAAIAAVTEDPGVRFLAGGTTLVDLMKLDVERPKRLIDVRHLGLDRIERTQDGGLSIGATASNTALAQHPDVKRDYAVLSQAILSGASTQLRNVATTAGNLLQRTRCLYFRDTTTPCNKREPGSGCSAQGGANRMLAILGTSEHCIATNPGDMAVAMAALEATVHVRGAKGERAIAIEDFHLLPGAHPERETALEPGDLITHVTLPPPAPGSRSVYLKLRDRVSYEFALASAAVVITVAEGRIARARLALGGVGTKPWRARAAETALEGRAPEASAFREVAEIALQGAVPRSQNGFKIELAKRCLTHTLALATETA